MDSSGEIVWQKLLGGNSFDETLSIQQTSDEGFIVAGYSNSSNTGTLMGLTNHGFADYWILKLDIDGNIDWQKLLGGSSLDEARSVQETSDGGFIVIGFSGSTNTGTLLGFTNNGNIDTWVLKLTSSGVIAWQKLLGGSLDDYGRDVQQTSDDGFIISSYSSSSNTGTLLGLTNNGVDDYWVFKLTASGNLY